MDKNNFREKDQRMAIRERDQTGKKTVSNAMRHRAMATAEKNFRTVKDAAPEHFLTAKRENSGAAVGRYPASQKIQMERRPRFI